MDRPEQLIEYLALENVRAYNTRAGDGQAFHRHLSKRPCLLFQRKFYCLFGVDYGCVKYFDRNVLLFYQ
jgi:hypothetical protein